MIIPLPALAALLPISGAKSSISLAISPTQGAGMYNKCYNNTCYTSKTPQKFGDCL